MNCLAFESNNWSKISVRFTFQTMELDDIICDCILIFVKFRLLLFLTLFGIKFGHSISSRENRFLCSYT